MISDKVSDDVVFIIEMGVVVIWVFNFMLFYGDCCMIGLFNYGLMGVGLFVVIGVQMSFLEWEVWGIVGDGVFNMMFQDFMIVVIYELLIKFLVFNNS